MRVFIHVPPLMHVPHYFRYVYVSPAGRHLAFGSEGNCIFPNDMTTAAGGGGGGGGELVLPVPPGRNGGEWVPGSLPGMTLSVSFKEQEVLNNIDVEDYILPYT
jgi:hypothetical protein